MLPPNAEGANTGAVFGKSFDLATDHLRGMAAWNFSKNGVTVQNYTNEEDPDLQEKMETLWNTTVQKFSGWTPPA